MAETEARSTRPELPEGYYVRNVEVVLDTVVDRYDDLLSEDERAFVTCFRGASEDAKRLWVRLACRKGPLFRRDRLVYPEIGDLDRATTELVTCGLLDDHPDDEDPVPVAELLALLLRDELAALVGRWRSDVPRGLRRAELVAALAEIEPRRLAEAARQCTGGVLRPLGLDRLLVVRLLFFGNLHQDWTELVLRDLGERRYERYALGRELRLFESREMLDHTLILRSTKGLVHELVAAGALDAAVDLADGVRERITQWHPKARRHADAVLARVGRQLERAERWLDALRLYAAAEAPPSRERRCRVLDRLGRHDEALTLVRRIGEEPTDETEAAFAPAFAHRLERKLGLTDRPWRRPRRPKTEIELPDAVAGSVELGVLDAFASSGRRGIFSENWLWRSLFGLAFWDIVYAPIPGAFHHPFQLGPLDLHSAEFRRARRTMVEERLDELREDDDLAARLAPIYAAKHGLANALVAWHPNGEGALRLAFELVSGDALARICARLVRDPGRYRRGLPDLLVERADSPVGFELLEVKAPGDQLRPEQGAWIDHLNAEGIPASVLHVRWLL